ncbi:unnamed protein product [Leptidea sinapis]|uniref:Cadherin domain-containing protein n=1 Tax=Leptidea sinapis TaxID=189913 RepID=A0A5E4PQT4_9NEOP|nr:unnamed protein product [Leptidea sinapis]
MARVGPLIQRWTVWFLVCLLHGVLEATPGPCEVETGQSSIIVDIEESRGDQVNQSTVPAILPIVGEPDVDVILSTVFPKGPTLFELDGKRLQLLEPLDRDAENLSHMVFQLVCQVKSTKKRRTIPVIVRVSDINDNAPVFQGTPYVTTVPELVSLGSTIFDKIRAVDIDAGVNGLSEYFIIPGDNKTLEAENAVDGYGYFAIPIPHQGQVTVNRSLDYERTQKYLVTIVASDRARDTKRRMSATTTMTVNVQDDDDQDPSFIYKGCSLNEGACINPEYSSYVNSGVLAGILSIEPEKIQAVDMDTLNDRIKYSIESGEPESWGTYFGIDEASGAVRQLVVVDTSVAKKFQLVIKAEEISEAKRFTTAKLTITVRPIDASPPVVSTTSDDGHVEENSPRGTKVLDGDGQPIRLSVSDPDLGPGDPKPKYTFELTTNLFDIDKDGFLIVNDEHLDRDPPNQSTYRVQIVAREANGGAASAPHLVIVRLLDQNDNAPVISKTQLITVPASLEPAAVYKGIIELLVAPGPNTRPPQFSSRDYYAPVSEGAAINSTVTTVTAKDPESEPVAYSIVSGLTGELVGYVHATDIDEGINAIVSYSIPSNVPFMIDNATGMITTSTELDYEDTKDYAFVVTATDGAIDRRFGTASVSVLVDDVPDEPPIFPQALYSVHVPENVPNYPVVKVHAEDPDTLSEITYTIIKGDTDSFSIDRKTGMIRTVKALDREMITRHEIIVGTEENNGEGNGATTTVEVVVDDKNDNAPQFTSVVRPVTIEDTSSIGSLVDTVAASDADATAPNNRVRYSLAGRGKASVYFHVEPDSGAVRLRDDLRKETDSEYTVDIQAYDQGEPVMSSVTSLTVYVRLGFPDTLYTEHVTEDSLNSTLVRVIPIWNKSKHSKDTPLKCLLTNSSQKAVFYVKLTEERDCAIYLNSSLDYETLTEYSLEVQLESIQGLINPDSSRAMAKDKDSGDFGKIEYRKNAWTKSAEEYFSLDTDTGVISNIKTFENVPKDIIPFKFNVMAKDNPKSDNSKTARVSVVINLLQKDNQMIIELADVNIDTMTALQARSLLYEVEQKSGLVAGLEKLTPRLYLGENGTLESDPKGTSVWLYLAIDAGVSVRAPLVAVEAPRRTQIAAAPLASAVPAALLALAALVLVAATAATAYICASWNRYKKHKEHAVQQQYGTLSMNVAVPRPASGYESSEDDHAAPRYETQVLNMAVDDADLQLDFSSNNHAFNVHNVQASDNDNVTFGKRNFSSYSYDQPIETTTEL